MTPDTFELDAVGRAVTLAGLNSLLGPRLPRPGNGEQYIGGPIPLGWVVRAAALPGKAFQLGMAVWFEAVRGQRDPTVTLSTGLMKQFGLSARPTRTRALEALESAGLVSVERRVGRPTVVTILPTGPPEARSRKPRPRAAG